MFLIKWVTKYTNAIKLFLCLLTDFNNTILLLHVGVTINGIHTFNDPVSAVNSCEALFIGGGNTFRLLKALYDSSLVDAIKNRVLLVS